MRACHEGTPLPPGKGEGNKKFKRLSLEKEVRLRYGYIIKAESCEEDENGNVTCVHCTYIPESLGQDVEGHKPKGVIHWVSATEGKTAEIRLYERLFKVPSVPWLRKREPT